MNNENNIAPINEDLNVEKYETENIKNLIYIIRGKQKLPYVFTEKGIIMLSGLLKNEIAVGVSIKIVEAFIRMKNFISNNRNLVERLVIIENKIDKKYILRKITG